MRAEKRMELHSEADLRTHALSILRRVNSSERGGLLFLLNPVLALEDAGFDLNASMRRHLLRGLRYGAKVKARIRELEAEVHQVAGRAVNVRSSAELRRLLFTDLKLSPPKPAGGKATPAPARASPAAPSQAGWDPEAEAEPSSTERLTEKHLEALRDTHPLVPKIIELRGILAGGWRFVDRSTYERVKAGATVTLLRGVRFRSDKSKAFLTSIAGGGH